MRSLSNSSPNNVTVAPRRQTMVEADLRRFEEAMRLPPALTPNELDARKQIKANLISACIAEALVNNSSFPRKQEPRARTEW